MEDSAFRTEAIRRGLVTFDQVKEAQEAQQNSRATGEELTLAEILIRRGIVTREQVQSMESGDPVPRSYQFGGYVILHRLGEGGMGVVYKAKRLSDGALVAVKVLPVKFSEDQDMVQRFEREARIACKMDHPNLVKGHELGVFAGRHFFAMELVQGNTLASVIKQQGRMQEKEALAIVTDVARAVQAIHKAGLIHRDIKPSNIMIQNDGTVKLMDLGLVKSVISELVSLTQSGMVVGTPHYMSPEQIDGDKDIDIRSDIYNLGATLYHMVTGAQPFSGTSLLEIVKKQMMNAVEDPRTIRPDLSESTCIVIERMLARERRDRYATPSDLLEDLDQIRKGQPPKTGMLEQGRSIVRRRAAAPPKPTKKTARNLAPQPIQAAAAPPRGPNSFWLWGGIGACGVLILAIVLLATNGSSPKKAGPEPIPAARANRSVEEIDELIRAGRFNDASALLEKEAATIESSRVIELQGKLREQAQTSWKALRRQVEPDIAAEHYESVKSRLQGFLSQVDRLESIAGEVKSEISLLESRQAARAERERADRQMVEIERKIASRVSAREFQNAIELLRTEIAASSPALADRIRKRIRELEEQVAATSGSLVALFNGKDLAGWSATPHSNEGIEKGEIVFQPDAGYVGTLQYQDRAFEGKAVLKVRMNIVDMGDGFAVGLIVIPVGGGAMTDGAQAVFVGEQAVTVRRCQDGAWRILQTARLTSTPVAPGENVLEFTLEGTRIRVRSNGRDILDDKVQDPATFNIGMCVQSGGVRIREVKANPR